METNVSISTPTETPGAPPATDAPAPATESPNTPTTPAEALAPMMDLQRQISEQKTEIAELRQALATRPDSATRAELSEATAQLTELRERLLLLEDPPEGTLETAEVIDVEPAAPETPEAPAGVPAAEPTNGPRRVGTHDGKSWFSLF